MAKILETIYGYRVISADGHRLSGVIASLEDAMKLWVAMNIQK